MAQKIEIVHPSGVRRVGLVGFSWTTLLFGAVPMAVRGEWWATVVMLVLQFAILLTPLWFLWIVAQVAWAFFCNGWWTRKMLERRGYRPADAGAAAVLARRLGVTATA